MRARSAGTVAAPDYTDSRFLTSALDHVLALAREHHRAAVHHRVIVGEVARPFEILLDDDDRHLALVCRR